MKASKNACLLTRLPPLVFLFALGTVGDLVAADFSVTATTTSFAYTINGVGGNPTITLERGKTYTFQINTTSSHPPYQ